ncbi:MAG: alpha/beta fold hydrolase, partial [Bacteroidota bacterium]
QESLSTHFTVYALSFSGHGGQTPEKAFTMDLFVQDTLEFMEAQGLKTAHFFGYSMGGYVALKLAQRHPEKVKKIVTLGTKFAWSPEIAAREVKMLDPEKVATKVPKFAAYLNRLHQPADWKTVMQQTAQMMIGLGDRPQLTGADFRDIQCPVLIIRGSEDPMVSLEESETAAEQLPHGNFRMLEDTPHPIEKVNIKTLAKTLTLFISNA